MKKLSYEWFCEKTGKCSVFKMPCEDCDRSCPNLIRVSFGRGMTRMLREKIFSRDKLCLKCGSKDKLTIDHIRPISRGGSNDESNLQTLCRDCNVEKGNMIIDYRKNG